MFELNVCFICNKICLFFKIFFFYLYMVKDIVGCLYFVLFVKYVEKFIFSVI